MSYAGQHRRERGYLPDIDECGTADLRSSRLPARRPSRHARPRSLRPSARAWRLTWRAIASRFAGGGEARVIAGQAVPSPPIIIPAMLPPLPPPPLALPRVAGGLAHYPVNYWLPAGCGPCPCGERWGPCLFELVREVLHHELTDLSVDSIVMAVVR